ncbi:MAG: hypothetical protein KJ808_10125, partial [Acidobacteria bacterium]|nr:hypothetical protein [Acidobacteriota bacterium]
FWIFLAVSDCQGAPEPGLKPALLWAVVAVFIAFNVADFAALHPKTLTGQKGVAYDYGFWPREKNERGTFSWTGRAAGKYFTADAVRDFAFFCEAPQSWLQKENMVMTLFWRGKLFQRVVFIKNQLKKIQLPRGQEGFLEIRVYPTFNIKAMNLGTDARELGVQFMEAEKPLL